MYKNCEILLQATSRALAGGGEEVRLWYKKVAFARYFGLCVPALSVLYVPADTQTKKTKEIEFLQQTQIF